MKLDTLDVNFSVLDIKQLNPLVLAYIGDAIYEVMVRTYLIDKNRNISAHKLHIKAINFVKASSQCNFVKFLMGNLTEEEVSIFKRGRNSKSNTVPKNADVVEYRMATGFEAVLGYLYLNKQEDRLNYIMKRIIEYTEEG